MGYTLADHVGDIGWTIRRVLRAWSSGRRRRTIRRRGTRWCRSDHPPPHLVDSVVFSNFHLEGRHVW